MKKLAEKLLKFGFGLFAAGMILTNTSCEIGLGEAVDIRPPVIEINYPPKGAIIRNTFNMSGNANDDTGIKSITITFTNKDIKNAVYTYSSTDENSVIEITNTATDKNSGSKYNWTATINKKTTGRELYNGWDLPDGDYFCDVEAEDLYGTKSQDRRSITIDNTAPVMILENLSTLGSETDETKLSAFGQKITITGKATDDHAIQKVVYTVYDEKKDLIGSSSVNYDMTSDGLNIAKYFSSEPANETDKVLWKNFEQIYGVNEVGKIGGSGAPKPVRYFCVQLVDEAREYMNPVYDDSGDSAQGTGEGNKSTEAYINTEDFGLSNLTIDDLNRYAKRTSDAFNSSTRAILSPLVAKSVAKMTVSGNNWDNVPKLRIDPEINPKWFVTNYEVEKGTKDFHQAYIGSSLTIMFEMGNDAVKFRPNNIRILLAKMEEDAEGNYKRTSSKTDAELAAKTFTTSSEDIIFLKDYGDMSGNVTQNHTETIKLENDYLKPAKVYRILVYGRDGTGETGQSFVEKPFTETNKETGIKTTKPAIYAFSSCQNGKPISITFLGTKNELERDGADEEGSWFGPSSDKIKFYFDVKTDNVNISNGFPKVSVNVTDKKGNEISGWDVNKFDVIEPDKEVVQGVSSTWRFKWKLVGKNGGKLPIPSASNIYKYNISVECMDENGTQQKGKIQFMVDHEKPEVVIKDESPYIGKENGLSVVNGKVTIPVDCTENDNPKTDSITYSVTGMTNPVTVTDEKIVLNTTDETLFTDGGTFELTVQCEDAVGNIGTATKTYKVNQSTNIPKIDNTGFVQLITDKANVKDGNNVYTVGSKLQLKITDDDGIPDVYVTVFDSEGTKIVDKAPQTMSGEILNYELPTTPGKYNIKVDVKDKEGITNSFETWVGVSSGSPKIQVTRDVSGYTGAGNYYKNSDEVEVNVTVANGSGVITRDGTVITLTNGYDTISLGSISDGYYEHTYKITDDFGLTDEKTISYYVDSTPPTLEITDPEDGAWFKTTGKLDLKGTVEDDGAGIAAVYYAVVDGTGDAPAEGNSAWETATINGSKWTSLETISLEGKPAYTLYVKAIDKMNLVKGPVSHQINVDKVAPTSTVSFTKNGGSAETLADETKNVLTNSGSFTLSGTVSDNLGNATVTVSDSANNTISQTGSNWTMTKSNLSSGDYTYTFTVTDEAGNKTDYVKTITVDKDAPTITNISVSPKAGDNVNGKVKLSLSLADNKQLVSPLTYEYTDKTETTQTKKVTWTGEKSFLSVSDIEIDTTTLKDNADTAISFSVKDKAGNTGTGSFTLKVDQSSDKPVVTLSNAEPVTTADGVDVTLAKPDGTNIFGITSNNKLRATIEDDDGIASVKVSFKKSTDPGWTTGSNLIPAGTTPTSYNLNYALPSTEGKYLIKIDVEDKYVTGTSPRKGETNYAVQSFTTWVGVSAGVPVITLNKPTKEYVTGIAGEEVAVNIPVTFKGGSTTTLTRTVTGTGVTDKSVALTQPVKDYTNQNFTDVIKASCDDNKNAEVTVTYSAVNIFGQKSAVTTYKYVLDNTKPKWSSLKAYNAQDPANPWTTYDENKWSQAANFKLKGIWTDASTGTVTSSGVAELKYVITSTGTAPNDEAAYTGSLIPSSTNDVADGWSFEQTIYGFTDGINYLHVLPVDKAGNRGAIKTFKMQVDGIAPTLTLDTTETGMKLVNNILYVNSATVEEADASKGVFVIGKLEDSMSGPNRWQAIRIFEGTVPQGYKDWVEVQGETLPAGVRTKNKSGTSITYNKDDTYHYTNEVGFLNAVNSDGTFKVKLDKDYFSKESGKYKQEYTITVVGEDNKVNRTTKNFTLFVDDTPPTVSNLSVTNLIETTGTGARADNVNGTITLQGNITDNDLVKTTVVKIWGADGATYSQDVSKPAAAPFATSATNTVGHFAYTIDTTAKKGDGSRYFSDNTLYTVKVISTDRTGNESTGASTQTTFFVNDSTDLPSVEFNNASVNGNYKDNVFGMGNWNISAIAKDDDGVNAVTIYKYDSTEPNNLGDKLVDVVLTGKAGRTQVSFEYSIPHTQTDLDSTTGENQIVFEIKDTNGTPKVAYKTLKYAIDNAAPSFGTPKIYAGTSATNYSPEGNVYTDGMFASKYHKVEIPLSDDNAIASVKVRKQQRNADNTPKVDGNNKPVMETDWVDVTSEFASGTGILSHKIEEYDGEFTTIYQITDTYGRDNELSLKYIIDSTAPAFTKAYNTAKATVEGNDFEKNANELGSGNTIWFRNNAITFAGTSSAIKEANINGEKGKIFIGESDTTGNPVTMANNGAAVGGLYNVNYSTSAILPEGTSKITIQAEDKAGNANSTSYYVNVDTATPEVSEKKINDSSSSFVTKTNTVKVTFNTKDITSGLKKAYLSTDSAMFNADGTVKSGVIAIDVASKTDKSTDTAVSQNFTVSTTTDSTEYTIYLVVEDVAGNRTAAESVGNFTLDQKAPVVNYDSISGAVNKTVSISGSVRDSNVLKAAASGKQLGNPVLYWKTTAGSTWTEVTGVTYLVNALASGVRSTDTTWTISDIDTTNFSNTASNADIMLQVRFTDIAENTNDASNAGSMTITVNQNGDRPVLTLEEISVNPSDETTLQQNEIWFTVTDDDGTGDSNTQIDEVGIKLYPVDRDGKLIGTAPATWASTKAAGGQTPAITWETTEKQFKYVIPTHTDPNDASKSTTQGNYKLIFQVKDKKDGTFETAVTVAANKVVSANDAASVLTAPVLKYKQTSDESRSMISFSVDSEKPTLGTIKIQYPKDYNENGTVKNWTNPADLENNTAIGGPNRPRGRISVEAKDSVTPPSKLTVTLSGFEDAALDGNLTLVSGDEFAREIDFTKKSGFINLAVTVTEPSHLSDRKVTLVIADNNAPGSDREAIQNVSPKIAEEVTGEVSYTGLAYDDKSVNSGIDSIEYYVPTYAEFTATGATTDKTKLEAYSWIGADGQGREKIVLDGMTWNIEQINLHKTEVTNPETGAKTQTVESDYTGYQDGTTGIFNMPVWFRLTDKSGNVGYSFTNKIKYNPDADRPSAAITYPVHDQKLVYKKTAGATDTVLEYSIMGGTILISGTARDNNGIGAVYVQYDADGDGDFDTDDYNFLKNNGIFAVGTGLGKLNSSVNGTWGILCEGDRSWQTSIDVSKTYKDGANDKYVFKDKKNLEVENVDELNADKTLKANANVKVLGVRVCTVENDEAKTASAQLWSAWSPVINISVNNGVPQFQNFVLKQYSAASGGTLLKTVPYEEDMFLTSGYWFLEGTIYDENGLSYIKVSKDVDSDTNVADQTYFGKVTDDDGNVTITGTVKIPVDVSGSAWKVQLYAEDKGTPKQKSQLVFSVKVDTVAPVFKPGKVGGSGANKDELVLFSGAYDETSGNKLHENRIFNSDGKFALTGRIEEAGSGYDRVAFYFTRGNTANTGTIRNPRNSITSPSTAIATEGTGVFIDTDGMALYKVEGTTRNNTLTISMTDALDDNIHVGGLVRVGGIYRRINTISADRKTVTIDSAAPVSETTVYFAWATMVIDAVNDVKTDDGDGMPESYDKNQDKYTWEASLNSHNIPDGPIYVHVVAFDKAGNMNSGYVKSYVSNNAPRIAKLYLGTDLNKDNKFGAGEFTEYARPTTSGGTTYTAENENINLAANFTVKNGLAVIPEFVGGNGAIKMVLKRGATVGGTAEAPVYTAYPSTGTGAGEVVKTEYAAPTGDLSATNMQIDYTGMTHSKKSTWTGSTQDVRTDTDAAFKKFWLSNTDLSGAKIKNTGKGTGETGHDTEDISLTFWDSTEGTTPGTNSQSATLYLTGLKYEMVDNVPPKVVIKPFKWNSKDDNSLYGNSTANGHIELEGDLSGGTWTGYTENAPKVSGKVVFRGTAYDNVGLSKLKFEFGKDVTANGETSLSDWLLGYVYATYNGSTWSLNSDLSGLVSGDMASGWGTMDGDGWHLKLYNTISATDKNFGSTGDSYFGQNGHKVAWELSINTEKWTNKPNLNTDTTAPAQLAAKLVVTAEDNSTDNNGGHNVSSTDPSTAAQEGTLTGVALDKVKNKSVYVMDVVPYVTKVSTSLSSKKKNNPSVYDRTAKGNYPVASTETIKLYGFNIVGGTAKIGSATAVNIGKKNAQNKYEAETDDKGNKYYALAVSTFDSGKLNITVNNVESINNKNSDTAAYNSQSNGDNNLNLVDDVKLDIWAFNSRAVRANGTGYAKEGVMKINPTNGTLGFAFASGTDRLAMANGSTNSYDIWQRNYADYSGIDFTYDAGGKTHGIGIGLDTQPSSGIAGRMSYITSKWGVRDTKEEDNFDYQNNFRIESVGLPSNVYLGVDKSTGITIVDTERFSSISIAAARGANNTNPTIYLAYYDRLNNQIRFRYGTNDLANNNGGNANRADSTSPKSSFGQFADNWGYAEDAGSRGNNTYYLGKGYGNSKSYNDHKVFESHPDYYSLIAGRSYTKTGGNDETTNLAAGPYVSLDVKAGTDEAGDIVPIVWYDGTDLWYTCRYGTKDDTANNANGVANKWIKPVKVMEGAGEYCVVKIDASGGIHIAAYDPVEADIRYAYLPSYTATDKVSSCVVDSMNIVGTQISMDVVKVGTRYVPYISYFYPSLNKSKMAYLDNFGWLSETTLQVPAGSDDDVYTGDWEISIIPSPSTRILDDNTNIGFYKNTDSTAKAFAAVTGYSFTAAGGTGEGKLVGLAGKSTPVVSYAVEAVPNGYLEIAQKK